MESKYIAFIHFDSLFTFYLSFGLLEGDNLQVIDIFELNYAQLLAFTKKLESKIFYYTNLEAQEVLFKTLKKDLPNLKSLNNLKDQKLLYQDYYGATNSGYITYNLGLDEKIINWTKIIDQEKFIYAPQLVTLMYLNSIRKKPLTLFDRIK
jgi:hypothetical protein